LRHPNINVAIIIIIVCIIAIKTVVLIQNHSSPSSSTSSSSSSSKINVIIIILIKINIIVVSIPVCCRWAKNQQTVKPSFAQRDRHSKRGLASIAHWQSVRCNFCVLACNHCARTAGGLGQTQKTKQSKKYLRHRRYTLQRFLQAGTNLAKIALQNQHDARGEDWPTWTLR